MTSHILTGVDFLDRALGGGQLVHGVHGLLGPIGGGKTTLGVMIAVEGARIQQQRALREQAAGRWVFVGFEQQGGYVKKQAWSHAGKIDRIAMQDSQLSDVRQARPYEISRASELCGADGSVPSELERFEAANRLLDDHFALVDCFNVSTFENCRTPMEYVSSCLGQVAQRGPIAGVVIDYLGLLVRRFRDWAEIGPTSQSPFIAEFVYQARGQIAERFACPVWLIHQLRGEANQRPTTTPQHHDDAAECRPFGEHLDACFCLGKRDDASGHLLLHLTKTPVAMVKHPQPTVLKFDENFASLVTAHDYRLSHTSSKIIREGKSQVTCDDHTLALVQELLARDRARP